MVLATARFAKMPVRCRAPSGLGFCSVFVFVPVPVSVSDKATPSSDAASGTDKDRAAVPESAACK